jgi:hypothetical protein
MYCGLYINWSLYNKVPVNAEITFLLFKERRPFKLKKEYPSEQWQIISFRLIPLKTPVSFRWTVPLRFWPLSWFGQGGQAWTKRTGIPRVCPWRSSEADLVKLDKGEADTACWSGCHDLPQSHVDTKGPLGCLQVVHKFKNLRLLPWIFRWPSHMGPPRWCTRQHFSLTKILAYTCLTCLLSGPHNVSFTVYTVHKMKIM